MAEQEELSKFRVKGRIDASDVELDPEVPLKIAAVHEGRILASTVLEPAGKTLDYELDFALRPDCGFRVFLGRADISDRDFLASELSSLSLSRRDAKVEARKEKAARAEEVVLIEAPVIKIAPALYQRWRLICRFYRVRGRVVCRHWRWNGTYFTFTDEPVPGATVEIRDVDCFWWFCKSDVITTATTGADGTFEAEFLWCCVLRRPWLTDPWILDPDLFERVRALLEKVRPRLPVPLPDPPPDPWELQPFLESLGGALEIGAARGTALAQIADLSSSETMIARRLPSADLEALHVWPWWKRADCRPDLQFRVTQNCEGTTKVIYEESLSQTRWDVPTDLEVTLLANDEACCIPSFEEPPCGDCFKWARVHCTDLQNIGGNDPLTSVPADLLGLAFPNGSDIAFARTMNVFGLFGTGSAADFYEIEYSRDGGPFQPLPANTLEAFNRVFWGRPCGSPPATPSQFNTVLFPVLTKQDAMTSSNHLVYESRAHFQGGCDPASWDNVFFPNGGRFWTSRRDLALRWKTADLAGSGASLTETPLLPDGLYELRVVGWKENSSGKLEQPKIMTRCNTNEEERLVIRLDNRTVPNHAPSIPSHPWGPGFVHLGTRDPDCDIVQMVKNEGQPGELVVAPCDVVELGNSDTLTVHYSVTVPLSANDRHLGGYWIRVHHSESGGFNAISKSLAGAQSDPAPYPGPSYAQAISQGAPRPFWGGGSYKIVLPGSAFPETCAYLFRLHAWKRVWNGCGPIEWFHDNDAEYSITIQKV